MSALETAVGMTLVLTVAECGFWTFIVWMLLKEKKKGERDGLP